MKITNQKKVLLINVTCGFGSTGRIVTGIYDELESKGCTCMVAYGRGTAPDGYNAYRIGTDFDVDVHGVLSRITDKQGLYSSAATRGLIDKIEEFGPDIVHLHNIHGYYLNYELLFKYLKKKEVQVIWTLHDCWSFTGHCTHFEYIGCNKWLNGCNKCEQLREYPKSLLMDCSKRNYQRKKSLFSDIPGMVLVTPSEWLKGKVVQSYMGKYPVTVVPTGIDLETFKPSPSSIREKYGIGDKFIVLGAANPWRERKGLDEFEKLSRLLSDRYQLVMVGLKKKQKEKLPANIIALERTDSVQEMAQWYSAADAYVNLTLEDTFPTTNIEALACGTPVITYKAGGSPESLTEQCGFVVSKKSIDGVVAALDILRNGDDRTDFCLTRAKEYSKAKRFSQYYTDVYANLLVNN